MNEPSEPTPLSVITISHKEHDPDGLHWVAEVDSLSHKVQFQSRTIEELLEQAKPFIPVR